MGTLFTPCCTRFKGQGQYKTFTYTQFKQHHFVNNVLKSLATGNRDARAFRQITLSKIGEVKVIVHRPIPDGFDMKTVSVTKKADGYYVTLSLDDKTVIIAVKPNGTSQECSICGHKVKKPLSRRIHNCPICHTSLCRDLNAAINIKARGTQALKAQLMSSLKSH
ncbi:MAG: zinc ribbon domain-containing protein [Nostocaceae cyanobacterium]|nr:zinc ribbon domain-containing protein [Nostocaceae cyanobacterium]